jgi:hypothetical protein
MSVIGPGQGIAAGPNLELGEADTLATAHPDDPGRFLIDLSGDVPALPRDDAVKVLEEHGFVVELAARDDARTDHGWPQVARTWWTAPCQPTAR